MTRTSSRTSESRSKSAKRSRSNTPVRSKNKHRTSLAAAPSTASTVTKSEEASTAGVQSPAKVAAAAPAVADKGGRSNKGDKNRCESSSRVEDRGPVSEEIGSNGAGNGVESVDSGHGKRTGGQIDDGRGELSFTGEDEQKGGSNNGPSSSGGNGFQVKETVTESRKDRHARRSSRQEEVYSGSKRSHGRTMQVEATNMSSGRGSPNST